MNKRQFEIYKDWRTKKYERDLEKKQDELAERGLALSGFRGKEEKFLKDEYEGDLARMESESLEYEETVIDNRKTSRNQRITNVIIVLVTFSSFFSTIYFSYLQNKRANEDSELRNRPYLVISNSEPVNLVPGKSADFKVSIKNVGIFPARIIKAGITCKEGNQINTNGKTVIGNGEQVVFNFSILDNLGSGEQCKFLFDYSTAGLFLGQKLYSTEYSIRFTNKGEFINEDAIIL